MGTVVGSKKQEIKISELGDIANKMFPDIQAKVFKGAFRLGIKSVLNGSGMKDWGEVAAQPAEIRRKFFHSALEASVPHLHKIGLTEDEAEKLISVLRIRNEKYLVRAQSEI
ncbi:MAG: hypothetical protein BWK80_17875 [Desulfobacteraceae bacterium IS3]|nr:MAG: hypothetical protein BWK80_17875 [Desulfobacteraceae bacterium IS3]